MEGPLRVRTLLVTDATPLAERLTPMEAAECLDAGVEPRWAIHMGARLGPSWAAYRAATGQVVGAFGYAASTGVVWSLWASLGVSERGQLLKATPMWLSAMSHAYGSPLTNHVSVSNKLAMLWLHKTGCFEWADSPHLVNGRPYLRFTTKPQRELDRMAL